MKSIKKVFAVLFWFMFLGITPVVFAGNSAVFDQRPSHDKLKVIGIHSLCDSYLYTHETFSGYKDCTGLRFNEIEGERK